MTRSSTNKLYTPYKDPEREFRSSRRHFKTLSLDELRSPDFNLLSDKEYSEEEEEEEKACRRGKVYNWETATYGKIWDNEDFYDLGSVETEFSAIVFNDMLTSKATLSCEPIVSSLNNDEIDFRISFDESDDEDCTIVYTANAPVFPIFYEGPREGNIDEYLWRIYESENLEVLES
ncbi:hypothetical protein Tco_1453678 [Tanacetum coccineum]